MNVIGLNDIGLNDIRTHPLPERRLVLKVRVRMLNAVIKSLFFPTLFAYTITKSERRLDFVRWAGMVCYV